MANEDWPITGVAVVSDVRKCPAGYTLIDRTYGNSEEADLWIDGLFSRKVTRYLCVERGAPTPGRNVLVDVSIVNERDPIPPGFSVLETTADSGEKATKKKMMCVRWMNPSLTSSALSELIILSRNVRRPPNGYTLVGEVNSLMLCYKMSNIKTQSAMTPQNSDTSLNMSEVQNNLPYPLNPRVDTAGNQGSGAPYSAQGGPAGYNAYSQRPGPPERSLSILGQNTVTPLSGVTWKLSPRIENLTNMKNIQIPEIRYKSMMDIENEYQYSFATERAAKTSNG